MARKRGIGDEIISLRNSGLKYDQIQERLKCSKSTIHYHCAKHGLTDIGFKSPSRISDEIANAIRDFLNIEGNTLQMAVEKFDLSLSTIKKYRNGAILDQNEK